MTNQLIKWLVSIGVSLGLTVAATAQDKASDVPTFKDAPVLLEKADAADFSRLAMREALKGKDIVSMGSAYEQLYAISQRLSRASGRVDIDWSVTLIDNDMMETWSLPGGDIVVYTGLMQHLNDKQEVASLVAHQMAHVLLGHDLFLLNEHDVQTNLLAMNASFEGNQWDELAIKTGAMYARDMHPGAYSRMMESEADDLAGVLLLKAGFDPAAQIGFWQFMKFEQDLPRDYVLSHPSLDFRIDAMQSSLPCYYQVYKEVWGSLPAGLGGIPRADNVQCPPIVTGVMGNIRKNNDSDVVYVRDDSDYEEGFDDGYDEGYDRGKRRTRIAYDWHDFGYRSIYYDHHFYHDHFYRDPYFLSWNYGYHSYSSFSIFFGGSHYYRWSPVWYGWNYYTPYRPTYRLRDAYRDGYRDGWNDRDRYARKANYVPRERVNRKGKYVNYDLNDRRGVYDGDNADRESRRLAREARASSGGGVKSMDRARATSVSNIDRPRRVKRDGSVASGEYSKKARRGIRDTNTIENAKRTIRSGERSEALRDERNQSVRTQPKRRVNGNSTVNRKGSTSQAQGFESRNPQRQSRDKAVRDKYRSTPSEARESSRRSQPSRTNRSTSKQSSATSLRQPPRAQPKRETPRKSYSKPKRTSEPTRSKPKSQPRKQQTKKSYSKNSSYDSFERSKPTRSTNRNPKRYSVQKEPLVAPRTNSYGGGYSAGGNSYYSTPKSTYTQPKSTYQAPKSTYTPPKSTYSAPKSSTYKAPKSTYKPKSGVSKKSRIE